MPKNTDYFFILKNQKHKAFLSFFVPKMDKNLKKRKNDVLFSNNFAVKVSL